MWGYNHTGTNFQGRKTIRSHCSPIPSVRPSVPATHGEEDGELLGHGRALLAAELVDQLREQVDGVPLGVKDVLPGSVGAAVGRDDPERGGFQAKGNDTVFYIKKSGLG